MDEAWKQFASDFNAMTDAEIASEVADAERDLEEAQTWLDAVASWVAAGSPRTPRHKEDRW